MEGIESRALCTWGKCCYPQPQNNVLMPAPVWVGLKNMLREISQPGKAWIIELRV